MSSTVETQLFIRGDGVLLRSGARAVVLKHSWPDTLVECPTRDHYGTPGKPGHFWTVARDLRPDPDGALAVPRPFKCANKPRCYHSGSRPEIAYTILDQCPNCGGNLA